MPLWLLGRSSLNDRTVLLDGPMLAEAGGIADAAAVMGALIETISNANGTAMRLADGTMIASHVKLDNVTINTAVGGGFRSAGGLGGGREWTFPVAFVDPPVVVASSFTSSFGVLVGQVSTTGATIQFTAVTSQSAEDRAASVMAIGRWF